jgi:hypothetical protein
VRAMIRSNSKCSPFRLFAEGWVVSLQDTVLNLNLNSGHRCFAGKLPWTKYDYNCLIPGIGAEDSVVGPPTKMHSTFFPRPSVVLVATPTALNVCILVG